MIAKRLIITGRVQGVGFRDWLIGQAERLNLVGWVRNAGEDSVEALIACEAPHETGFARRPSVTWPG